MIYNAIEAQLTCFFCFFSLLACFLSALKPFGQLQNLSVRRSHSEETIAHNTRFQIRRFAIKYVGGLYTILYDADRPVEEPHEVASVLSVTRVGCKWRRIEHTL